MDRSGYRMNDLGDAPPSPPARTGPVHVPDLWEVENTPDPDFSSARVLLPSVRLDSGDDSSPPDPEREALRATAAEGVSPAAGTEPPTSRRWRSDLDGSGKDCSCSTKRLALICFVVVLCAVVAVVAYLYATGKLFGRKGIFSGGGGSDNNYKGDGNLYLIGEERAARTKAYCLDGSRPGYYFIPGTGQGKNKWRLHLDGGGSCDDVQECYSRSLTDNGSTRRLQNRDDFDGFLSSDPQKNPDFYDWNLVYIHYCDGACFTSNRPDPVTYRGKKLYFRGQSILDAVLDDLNDVRGLSNATSVILSGNSAGGIAVYRQADHVRSKLPPSVQFKAFPASGLMVWETNAKREEFFKKRAELLGMLDGPDHPACKQAFPGEHWKCLLPQFAALYVTSDLFVLNSAFDSWALNNILKLTCRPQRCSGDDKQLLDRNRAEVVGVTANLAAKQGAYIPSCDDHSIIATDSYRTIRIGGKTPAEAFADWFFDRTPNTSRYIDSMDCCNPTC